MPRLVTTAQVLVGFAAALALLYFLRDILIPFVIAFVLAILIEALVGSIRRRWPAAPRWIVSTLAGLLVTVSTAAGLVILAQGAVGIVQQGPALLDRLDGLVQSTGRSLHISEPLHFKALVGQVDLAQVAGFLLSGLQGVGGTILLIVIYLGFMLFGAQRIRAKHEAIAEASLGNHSPNRIIASISAGIRIYLWIHIVTGALVTAAATAVMIAVGLNNVLFWSVIFFLLTFIPNIGVTAGSIAPALFALLQFPSVWPAIAIFAFIQVTAFVVGNLVYPHMQAKLQNIDPVVTIFALTLWTLLWGLSGAFLAVPLTLMLMMIFAQFDSTRWVAAVLSNDGKPDFGEAD